MSNDKIWSVNIGQACQGSEESVNWLTQQAQGKVRAYIYRVTLDNDLSDDLTQETLLQMIKSIKNLNEKENFWPWMYRIAQSKVQEHYRGKQKEANVVSEESFYKDLMSRRGDIYQDESVRELIQQDLLKKVMVAMKELKQKHRAVLSLRCFDNLSYAEIADTFDCNEVTARIMFYRARKALRKKLSNKGISGNMMIMSLGLFGRLTLSPEASQSIQGESISKASLKVGPAATIIGNVFTKQSAAVIAIAIILWMIFSNKDSVSSPPVNNPPIPTSNLPFRNEVNSLHFTVQVLDGDPNTDGSLSKGAYERWFYFPEGIDGPSFMRMQRYNPDFTEKLCAWLENEQACYYYESGADIVYITNSRVAWSNLRVRRLPTDPQELIDFIEKVEGDSDFAREYFRDEKTGLVVSSIDNRFANVTGYISDYEYNTLSPETLEYKWDEPVESVVDKRDEMHKRGWGYYRIEGELDGKKISGHGRIPFFYNTCKEYSAWISINIGNELEIIDCGEGAQMRRPDGTVIASYPAGTFLKGLARPWMGMHTADTIRRDAAEKRIWFFSEWHENEEDVVITLFDNKNKDGTNTIYTVSYENDIIENIIFTSGEDIKGTLDFTYLQDLDKETAEFKEPVIKDTSQTAAIDNPDTLWIMDLAEGKL
ncbi:MAG: RNA polymerase sigma factor [Sedimentisphaerales bacterium]|nr:RNA polymerase sigma factor [Sedimentisphaerales bacterium]